MKVICDEPLSNVAFKFYLRRYTEDGDEDGGDGAGAVVAGTPDGKAAGPSFLQKAAASLKPRRRRGTSSIASASAPRELTPEQEAGLSSAFTLFDDAGLGRLDESQLREVLRSADACVGGDEDKLAELARSIAASAAAGREGRKAPM
jgi:hypothetical protein